MPLILSAIFGGIGKVFTGLFTFFTTKPGCYLGMVLLVLVALWGVDHRAYKSGIAFQKQDEATRIAAAQIDAYEAGIKRQTELDRGLIAAADRAAFERGKAQARTIVLTREVARYVTPEIDRAFPVACAVVRMHDAAALGKTAADLGEGWCGPDGSAAPIAPSDFANVFVGNYGQYHELAAQVIGLQDTVRAMAKALGATLEVVDGKVGVVGLGAGGVDLGAADQHEEQSLAEAESGDHGGVPVASLDVDITNNGPGGS